MPISEHERKVLEQLERDFRPPSASRADSRWSNISTAKRRVGAAGGLVVGLLSVILGLVENSAGGILLAVVGYGLIVGSVWIVVDCTSGVRVAFVRVQQRTATHPPRPLP